MNYSSAGVLNALAFSPIGEGAAYSESEGKLHPSKANVEVSTVDGLLVTPESTARRYDDTIRVSNGSYSPNREDHRPR